MVELDYKKQKIGEILVNKKLITETQLEESLEIQKETGEKLGAGEFVVNSIDADGTKEGYELNLTRLIADHVAVPVIASGGAGTPEHLRDVLTKAKADAALIASMVHYGTYTISEIKTFLAANAVKIRKTY